MPIVGRVALLHHLQHAHVVVRLVGHRGDLDDVGIERLEPGVQLAQVVRRVAEVVVADDPLRLAEPRNLAGDVVFQIDVLDAVGDRLAEHDQPGFFAARVLAAVLLAADGDHRRARPVLQQPLDIHPRADVVQPQLDQLGPLLHQVLDARPACAYDGYGRC